MKLRTSIGLVAVGALFILMSCLYGAVDLGMIRP